MFFRLQEWILGRIHPRIQSVVPDKPSSCKEPRTYHDEQIKCSVLFGFCKENTCTKGKLAKIIFVDKTPNHTTCVVKIVGLQTPLSTTTLRSKRKGL